MTTTDNYHPVYASDFKRFIKKRKAYAVASWMIFSLATAMILLVTPNRYKSSASFRDLSMQQKQSSILLKSLLNSSSAQDSITQPSSMMYSRTLLEKIILKHCLQADVKEQSFKDKIFRRINDNIELYKTGYIKKNSQLDVCALEVSDGAEGRFLVQVETDGGVLISTLDKKLVSFGRLNQSIQLPKGKIEFSLKEPLKDSKTFVLRIFPMQDAVAKLNRQLKIKPRRQDPSILDLSIVLDNQGLCATILNDLMSEYKNYLCQEQKELAKEQLSYLAMRQKTVADELDMCLKDHVGQIQNFLDNDDYLSAFSQVKFLEAKKQEKKSRLFEIEKDLDGLGSGHLESFQKLCPDLYVSLMELDRERKLFENLEQSFFKEKKKSKNNVALNFNEDFSLKFKSFLDAKKDQIDRDSSINAALTKETITKGNESYFTDEEKIDQDRASQYLKDFEGVDLEMAKSFYVSYTEKVDQSKMRSCELLKLSETLSKNDPVEYGAFLNILGDQNSQQILSKLLSLQKKSADTKYYSSKDRTRMQKETASLNTQLSKHIDALVSYQNEQEKSAKQKVNALRSVILDLLGKEISFLESQKGLHILEKKQALAAEKKLVEQELAKVQESLKTMPEKWLLESRLQIVSDLKTATMEGVAKLVESKTIEHHLAQLESKPLDKAMRPLKPFKKPFVALIVLGATLGMIAFMVVLFCRRLSVGTPVSFSGLRRRGFVVSGTLSKRFHSSSINELKPCDIATLRNICALSQQDLLTSKIIGCMVMQAKNFSHALASLLALGGKGAIVIELFPATFKKKGLMHFLLSGEKSPSIEKHGDYDVLPLGGQSQFIPELISRRKFERMLRELCNHYDRVIIASNKKAGDIQSKLLQKYVDRLVVSIDDENYEDLYPLLGENKDQKIQKVSFVAFEE